MSQDFWIIVDWWSVLFFVGIAAYPLTRVLFRSWWDKGYLFSKAVGLAAITFISWYLGSFKILPFTFGTIILSIGLLFVVGIGVTWYLHRDTSEKANTELVDRYSSLWKYILLELLFFICLWFWSYIKAFEPDIHGLEKFMDYGFARAIFNSMYFPPPDIWYAGGTINYYYFGHTMMALLSKLSFIDLSYGYNLMLASIFAFCFTMSFSIASQLSIASFLYIKKKPNKMIFIITGLIAAFLVTLAGNMQTIYAFTQGYNGENTPPPFWNILWPAKDFLTNVPQGINTYWYANATRFIPFTIHEFPSYSFVVSDNHGHVLGIPFTLLAIASLFLLFGRKEDEQREAQVSIRKISLMRTRFQLDLGGMVPYILYGVLSAILFMTNALDGPIYMGLFGIFILLKRSKWKFLSIEWISQKALYVLPAVVGFLITALPFLLNFTSFANGLAINCPPAFLANTKIGPIIFEGVEKCQKSPLWMMALLWGFFWFNGIVLTLLYWKRSRLIPKHIPDVYRFLLIVFIYCVALIFFSEFFYFKDIYPQHFRSNTMFKLGYQAFMMCSLLSGFVIIQMTQLKKVFSANLKLRLFQIVFFLLLLPQLFLVSIFPLFSVRSYFNGLSVYKGLFGLTWFQNQYPDDYKAMWWLATVGVTHKQTPSSSGMTFLASLSKTDTHVKDNFFTSQVGTTPVIVEADGDSYTDYERMSAFSGMPTIVGWGVHEWLWRGTYDVVAPRKDEVKEIYETSDQSKRLQLLNKYNVTYIVIGKLEREKFTNLNENQIAMLGKEVFRSGSTVIYERF